MCVIVVFKAVDMFCLVCFQYPKFVLNSIVFAIVLQYAVVHMKYLCVRVKKCVCVMLRVCCAVQHKSTVECMHKNMQKAHSRKRTKPRVGAWCTAWVHTAGTHIWHTRIFLHLQHQLGHSQSRTTHSHKYTSTHSYIHIKRANMQCVHIAKCAFKRNGRNKNKTIWSDASFFLYGFCSCTKQQQQHNK